MTEKTILITCLMILFSVPMSACGIKPNSVDAPSSVEKDRFPRTYPTK